MEKLNKREQYIWLAGVIDSECTIGFYKKLALHTKRGFCWMVRLNCGSVTPKLLHKIREFVGAGRVHLRALKQGNNGKTIYEWEIYGNNVRHILPKVLPFLLLKKKQANLMIEALALLKEHGWKYTPHDKKLEGIWQEMRKLNKRGIN